ncbi:GlxA family transcriptional regulator [Motiliproteus sp. MSK22-1]|uniref:GlxA family transcriptional regulator n=1 Tax=Motiliproteus sp. MSK22-1 TaxID=1897630 RepID=UPI0009755DFC|nr:helix-turn-helix domain-containing protein [Motiliproteus sp. MSK22-1]OMH39763.1 hypothetical protein BGP75_01540 [Motiliproteus sp. MSK22-1]
MKTPPIVTIAVLSYPGVLTSSVHGLAELFNASNRICGRFREMELPKFQIRHFEIEETTGRVISATDQNDHHRPAPNRSKQDGIPQDKSTQNIQALIVLPSIEDNYYESPSQELIKWIQDLHKQGTIVCSVCAGAFILAAAGVVDGRTVTTHWGLAEKFRERYPTIKLDADQILIDEQDLITAGGVMAWLDLGIHLVERFSRPTVAIELGKFLLIDTGRREQKFYRNFQPPLDHGDQTILKAQHYIHRHYKETISVKNLAILSHRVERSFYRNFIKSTGYNPGEYLQNFRIQKARELIETKQLSFERIGWEVGYADSSAFRKMFQKITGLTPGQYRQRFTRQQNLKSHLQR